MELCVSSPETNIGYCRACNSQRFKQNFKNWTSGNHDVDEFIQKVQLKATKDTLIIEWIEYDNFKDVEYLAKGGFGATFKAVWKDGFIGCWRDDINRWGRAPMSEVALKCLYNSQGITADFLKEIESHILVYKNNTALDFIVRCHESKNADNDDLECSEFLLTNDLTELNINYINFKDKEN
ncbi:kinase-like domain-containing protein [Rhizophagus irregularis DAOM 181602=DAOM 197198]|nr:kinase-like domain-containing protein [Rhizophagus irregularis DAOM 181602=DAOM 197198]